MKLSDYRQYKGSDNTLALLRVVNKDLEEATLYIWSNIPRDIGKRLLGKQYARKKCSVMFSKYPECWEQHAHLTFKALLAVICTAKFNCISTQCVIIPTKKSRYFPIHHSQTGLSNEEHCIICEIKTECVYLRCRLTGVFNKAVPYLRR